MPSDQLVDAKVILEAMAELKRRGKDKVLQHLEATERDLAEFVLEEITLLHHRLLETGGSRRQIKRLRIQVEQLVLVSILSLQKAHYQLWKQELTDTPLSQLDPSPDQDGPTTAPPPGPPNSPRSATENPREQT